MAIDTNPYGKPIVRTLRVDIPIDLWRRLQLVATEHDVTIPEALLIAAEGGLEALAPVLRLRAEDDKPRTYGEHLEAARKRAEGKGPTIEVLHDGVEVTHADAPVIEDAEFEDVKP